MNLGLVTRSLPHLTNREAAAFLVEHGFGCTELCLTQADSKYWIYNGRADLAGLTDDGFQSIVATYRDRGIAITALGCFTNLIDPDEDARAANLAFFTRLLQLASLSGIPCVATECGFTPGKRGVNADSYEADFARLRESLAVVTRQAARLGVVIALEPCVLDIVPSAKRAADLLGQVGSDHLKILLDPANLIANNTLEEMFDTLAPAIAYFHGKDRKVNDAYGRLLGEGDIDWPRFFRLYHRHTEGLPFILEYAKPDQADAIRDRVRHYDRASRV